MLCKDRQLVNVVVSVLRSHLLNANGDDRASEILTVLPGCPVLTMRWGVCL